MNVPPNNPLKSHGTLLVSCVEPLLTKTSLSRCFGSKMSTAKAGLGLCAFLVPPLAFHVFVGRHWHNRETP